MRFLRLAAALLSACDGGAPACDAASLEAQLESASSGDVVEVGDCEVAGRFTVGPGVTLAGTGASSAIVSNTLGETLRVEGGATATIVRGLRVEADGHAALIAMGGAVVLEELVVSVPERGIGVAAEGVTSLTMTSVRVEGAVSTEADAAALPDMLLPPMFSTHGIALFDVADAALADVDVSGFARFGALFVRSTVRWEGGGVAGGAGTGVMVLGGSAELTGIAVRDLWDTSVLQPTYGAVFADGADVTTDRLEVFDTARVGVLESRATAAHVDLSVHDNGDVGLWTQDAVSSAIMGSASEIARNTIAGLVIVAPDDAAVLDASISNTALGSTILAGTFGIVEASDGVHLLGGRSVMLAGLSITGNERTQVLVDLAGTNANAIMLDAITVDGTGAAFGVVPQGGAVPAEWDDGVTRLGATVTNDMALTTLDTLGAAGVDQIPSAPPGGNLRGIVMPVE